MSDICQRIIFTGHVQGVGFRYTAERIGNAHGVSGWVSNRDDGTVEMVVCGTRDKLKGFIDELGERMSGFIRQTVIQASEPGEQFSGFSIRR